MNYTLRDKSGKNLGSFDVPSLIQMLKASRLKGDEDYLGPNSAWLPIRTISELAGHLPAAAAPGLEPQAPDNLMNIFSDLGDGEAGSGAVPDFTLPSAQPNDKTLVGPPPAAKAPPSPPPKPAASAPATDDLWAEDEPAAPKAPPPKTPPPPKPASPSNDSLDFSLDLDSPPAANAKGSSEPLMQHDPLGDLLQEAGQSPSAPPAAAAPSDDFLSFPDQAKPQAPPPSKPAATTPKKDDDSLEDLFSAPADQSSLSGTKPAAAPPATSGFSFPNNIAAPTGAAFKPAAPADRGGQSLDSILNASPDAFASDLSMPDPVKAPAPSPSAPPPKATTKAAASAPQLLTEDEEKPLKDTPKKKAAKGEGIVGRITAHWKMIAATLGGIAVLGIGTGVVLKFKSRLTTTASRVTAATAPTSGSGEAGAPENINIDEKTKQLMDRDNYGLYLQAAKLFEDGQAKGDADLHYTAGRLEALCRAQFRLHPDAATLAQLDKLAQSLATQTPMSPAVAKALAAHAVVKGEKDRAKSFIAQVLQANPKDAAALGLAGLSDMRSGDLAAAQENFEKAVAQNPAHLPALYGLAQIAQKKAQPPATIESALKRVVELSPSHVAARIDLGQIYVNEGNLGEAEKNVILVTGSQSKDASGPELARAYFLMGQILERQNKKQDAAAQFQKAVGADPNNPDIQYKLGNAFLADGKIEDAKNRFMAAIQIEPRVDFKVGYATALMTEKKYGDALLWLQQAIRTEPGSVTAQYRFGLVQKALGNTDEAVSALRKAQAIQPGNLDATVALAEIFSEMKKYDLAITEYRNAIAASPKDPAIHLKLGSLLLDKGQYASAAGEFDKAMETTVDVKQKGYISHMLGNAYMADGNYDGAIAAQKHAIAFNGELPQATLSLGIAYFKKGAYAEALETLEGLRETNPQGDIVVDLNYNLANAYLENVNYERALQYYNLVLKARPSFFMVHYQLGNLYYKQNAYLKAIDEYRTALPKLTNPDEIYDTYLAIGRSYQSLGELPKAEATYLDATRKFPKKHEAYFRLGQIYDEQQALPKAVSYYQQTLKINPKDDRAYFYLGYDFKSMNRPLEALDSFKKSLAINPHSKNAEQAREEIEMMQNARR